jgi:hypothetical protein
MESQMTFQTLDGCLKFQSEFFLNETGKIHDQNSQTATSTNYKHMPSAEELCTMNQNIVGPFPPISDTFVQEQTPQIHLVSDYRCLHQNVNVNPQSDCRDKRTVSSASTANPRGSGRNESEQ